MSYMAHAANKNKQNPAVQLTAKRNAPTAKKTLALKAKPADLKPEIKPKSKKAATVIFIKKVKPKAKTTKTVSPLKTAKLPTQKNKSVVSARNVKLPAKKVKIAKVVKVAKVAETKKNGKIKQINSAKKLKPTVKKLKPVIKLPILSNQKAKPKAKKTQAIAPILKSKSGKAKVAATPKKIVKTAGKAKLTIFAPNKQKLITKVNLPTVKAKKNDSAKKIESIKKHKQIKISAPTTEPKAAKIKLTAPPENRKQSKLKLASDVKKITNVKKVADVKKVKLIKKKIEPEILPRPIKPKKKRAKAISSAVFRGKKGRYDFAVFPIDAEFEDVPAIYIISRRIIDKRKKAHHALICIGQTDSLVAELKKHRKGKCVKKFAANSISLLREESEKQRLKIEFDLKSAHAIPCVHT